MNGSRLAHNHITAPSYFLLLLLTLTVAGCSSEKVGPGVSEYGVGSLSRAMADYETDYPGRSAEDLEANEAVVEEIKRLIAEGADVNHQRADTGRTPLHNAVLLNASEIVRVLLDAGARLDIEGNEGFTPLEYARQLEEHGPDWDFSRVIRLLEEAERKRAAQGALLGDQPEEFTA
ncbi:ankyrin repeat domain-containing protein [Aquisalimonas lutea]|uniref:ankyrin repeat domain-containing protein n=1 Tax=Aquisalimonas lutea TaxID=1327750 RepID=UPI0025B3F895|nr:ankyrin repeat domain-containing protein [Aquisalimonas lutea]MDN3518509.1 ankyrin repeat domain-containing protein [Aquisalimonas lutea]